MKKITYVLLALSICSIAQAQWVGTNPVYFNAGNVGIGTSTPFYTLSVKGGPSWKKGINILDANSRIYFDGKRALEGDFTNNLLSVGESFATTRLFGNVGIGASPVSNLFRVEKNWGTQGTAMVNLNSTSDGDVLYVKNNSTRADMFIAKFLNSSGTAMAVRADGNVGIGTTAPSGKLEIQKNVDNTSTINSLSDFSNDQLVLRNTSTTTGAYAGMAFVGNANELLGKVGFKRHSNGNGRGEFFVSVDNAGVVTEALLVDKEGSVGIGTSDPSHTLTIQGGPNGAQGINIKNANSRIYFDGRRAMEGHDSNSRLDLGEGFNKTRLFGNVGIGNNDPLSALDVDGSISLRQSSDLGTGRITLHANNFLYLMGGLSGAVLSDDSGVNTARVVDGSSGYFSVETGDGTERLRINSIGDAIFQGNIESKKVKVSQNPGNWPDFVFKPSFTLRPLSEVEDFIQANKHLPEVPSAMEVETNGLDLGKMDATLLQKVEELTLYLIDQNKRLEKLETENKQLKKEIKGLKKGK